MNGTGQSRKPAAYCKNRFLIQTQSCNGQRKANFNSVVREGLFIQNKDVYRTPQFPNTTATKQGAQGVGAPPTSEVIWCWNLLVITHCSVSCGLMYTSPLFKYPQTIFSWSLLLLPFLTSYLSGSYYTVTPQFFVMWLPVSSLLLTSPGYTSPSPSNKHSWYISLPVISQLCFSASLLFSDRQTEKSHFFSLW